MKQKYQHVAFRIGTLKLIEVINKILDEYVGQGFKLTVRQLYYQLVSRDMIPNTEKSYKKIVQTVNDARIAGLIDWDVIEDLTRSFITRGRWDSPAQIVRDAAAGYHEDMWENQESRVFCIIEKEALVSIFRRVCHTYDVPLLAARGYPSASALREFAHDTVESCDQRVIILHLGDHDPSGIDMSRDLKERIQLFSFGAPIEFHRIALNMEQVEEVKPPPNPAKQTDSRFYEYERMFGNKSWELDALSPSYLNKLVTNEISLYIDDDRWDAKKAQIEENRSKLWQLADQL